MDKLNDVAIFVSHYGYLAIFLLVFLQEIGIPNPVTNELVLMFGGYLSYFGSLSLVKVIVTVILADVSGTCLLFFSFYFFGNWLFSHKPKWFPVKAGTIDKLKRYVYRRGTFGIFIGRLTPFLRGYVSVAAGILRIRPKKFVTIVTFSALTWSGGLVAIGWMVAPYWNIAIDNLGIIQNILLLALIVAAITITGWYVLRSKPFSKSGGLDNAKPSPSLKLE